ncbi:thioredoxin-like protein [Xylariaceae sp. FL0255]|nr:thioredoxin-like protein [Xylariaceae sp. FL0255]
MGGTIEIYIDIASFYSYIAFVQLQLNKDLLKQNSVEVDIHPAMIGAINVGSGNKPPWTVPAKGAHSKFDIKRSADAVGLKNLSPPGNLMEAGKTQLVSFGSTLGPPIRIKLVQKRKKLSPLKQPMRALLHIKSTQTPETFTKATAYLFHSFWNLHKAPNDPATLAEVLASIPSDFRTPLATPGSLGYSSIFAASSSSSLSGNGSSSGAGGQKLLTPAQVKEIVTAASSEALKNALKASVAEALARGAFGAPWIWATNDKGQSEPFFGSDRWHFVYAFLNVPYGDVRLLAPGEKGKAAL